MPAPLNLPLRTKLAIVKDYEAGLQIYAIAWSYSISESTVLSTVKRFGHCFNCFGLCKRCKSRIRIKRTRAVIHAEGKKLRCTRCRKMRPARMFNKHLRPPEYNGRRYMFVDSWCKLCHAERARERNRSKRDAKKASASDHGAGNQPSH